MLPNNPEQVSHSSQKPEQGSKVAVLAKIAGVLATVGAAIYGGPVIKETMQQNIVHTKEEPRTQPSPVRPPRGDDPEVRNDNNLPQEEPTTQPSPVAPPRGDDNHAKKKLSERLIP